MFTFLFLAWFVHSLVLTGLLLLERFYFQSTTLLDDYDDGFDWFFFALFYYVPIFQIIGTIQAITAMITLSTKRFSTYQKEVRTFHKDLNTLYMCSECDFIVRGYKTKEENYEKCCKHGYQRRLTQSSYPDIYEFALETGLTPKISKKKAFQLYKQEKDLKKQQAKKEKMEREKEKEITKLLNKTKFIEKQTGIYTSKEHVKLQRLYREMEGRKEHALQTLKPEERENLSNLIDQFDALYQTEMASIESFEQRMKETLAETENKIEKLLS